MSPNAQSHYRGACLWLFLETVYTETTAPKTLGHRECMNTWFTRHTGMNQLHSMPSPPFFPYSTQDNTLHPWNGILIGGLIKVYEYWETRALKKKSKSCCNKSGKEVLRRDKVVFLDAALKDLRLWGRQFLFKSSTHFQWGLLEDSILIFNWGIIAL